MDDYLTSEDFGPKGVFGQRGVREDVARFDHAFARYEVGDPSGVLETHRFGMSDHHLEVARELATRSRGLVMRRWAVPEADPLILPQLRPDKAIWTGAVKRERHHRMPAAVLEKHVGRDRTTREDVLTALTEADLRYLREEYGEEFTATGSADHFKIDPKVKHIHIRPAKAIFPENRSVRLPVIHDHEGDPRWSDFEHDRGLSNHLERYHKARRRTFRAAGSIMVPGRGGRWRQESPFVWYGNVPPAWEYHTHPIKRDVEFYARRLSWHPWRRDERWRSDRALMILEGELKEASCAGTGWATFSCPSVWQFDAPELEAFAAAHLGGRAVFVVSDSDWEPGVGDRRLDDDSVLGAALEARDALRRCLVDAHFAAPPAEQGWCDLHEEPAGAKAGPDDAVADGVLPDDFLVVEREVPWFDRWHPERSLERWLIDHGVRDEKGAFPRTESRFNGAVILRWIAEHATPSGVSTVALSTIAKRIGDDLYRKGQDPKMAVRNAVGERKGEPGYLVRWGIVKTKGLEARRAWYVRQTEEWAGEVQIVPPELRAVDRSPRRTVREFLGSR